MKKKRLSFKHIALAIIILLASLWIVGRVTGAFQYYRAATPSSEPSIKQGEVFFTSNLVKPSLFDFVCFEAYMKTTDKVERTIFRVCGMEGDIVELKNGDLFVNNVFADEQLKVQHFYKLTNLEIERLPKDKISSSMEPIALSADTSFIFLNSKWAVANNFKKRRFTFSSDDGLHHEFSKLWSADNFGPIKVPANSFFMLGDNRHNALDSRFIGFVSKDSIMGTVLGKH